MADNTNTEEDVSLKWIDGGPDNPAPEFNLDNPTMWMPMTVMNGLASGFMERAAVVSSTVTGFPSGLDITSASKVAKNFAAGVPVTSIFSGTADPIFRAPTSPGASVSNYMVTVDSAICCLISTGGFVNSNNRQGK